MTIDTKDMLNSILSSISRIDYVRPDDIPNIDLYMDQVTTFMEKELASSKRHEDDKILTKTMINNYAKNDLLPPPVKKKYSKEHMLLLIFIYYFKNILSIQKDFAVNPASFYQIIHTVDRLEKCGFTTTTRSDKRGDLIWLDLKVNVFQCLKIAII